MLECWIMDVSSLSALETLDGYRRLFTDLPLWTPYVEEVLRRHGLQPLGPVRVGVPGTYPTFLVAERWVVKFFGRLFDGAQAFAAEQEAARLAAGDPGIRSVALAGAGELGMDGWPWPYLIFSFMPGASIGTRIEQIEPLERVQIAGELGDMIRRLHSLPLEGSPVFANTHAAYRQFLSEQRADVSERLRAWGSLPERLIAELDHYLPPLDEILDTRQPPHLIHADLTGDHLLGTIENGRWHTSALIDFGDARTGDLLYELGALHMDLFHHDRRLLSAFLDSYGMPRGLRAGLPRKALATALLHQFDLFGGITETARQSPNLETLAQRLFGPPEPDTRISFQALL